MQLGMIGLGRMGANMVRRAHPQGGHECVVFDMSPKAVGRAGQGEGRRGGVARRFRRRSSTQPRAVWLMVPAAVVDETIADLAAASRGGRHPHRRRQFLLRRRHPPREGTGVTRDPLRGRRHQRRRVGPGTRLLHDDRRRDRRGRSISIRSSRRWRPAWATFRARRDGRSSAAPPNRATCTAARTAPATSSRWSTTASSTASWPPTPKGWASCAPPTSASRQHDGRRRNDAAARPGALPVRPQPARHRRGVAARQRDRLVAARPDGRPRCVEDPALAKFAGRVSDSGEGRWTIKAAIDEAVPAPVLTTALYERFARAARRISQDKLLSAMRFQFGGHLEKTAEKRSTLREAMSNLTPTHSSSSAPPATSPTRRSSRRCRRW